MREYMYKAMRAAERYAYVDGREKRKERVRSSSLVHMIYWMRARVRVLTRYACVMMTSIRDQHLDLQP